MGKYGCTVFATPVGFDKTCLFPLPMRLHNAADEFLRIWHHHPALPAWTRKLLVKHPADELVKGLSVLHCFVAADELDVLWGRRWDCEDDWLGRGGLGGG